MSKLFRVRFLPERRVPRSEPLDYGVVVAETAEAALDDITERYGNLAGKAWFRMQLEVTEASDGGGQ